MTLEKIARAAIAVVDRHDEFAAALSDVTREFPDGHDEACQEAWQELRRLVNEYRAKG